MVFSPVIAIITNNKKSILKTRGPRCWLQLQKCSTRGGQEIYYLTLPQLSKTHKGFIDCMMSHIFIDAIARLNNIKPIVICTKKRLNRFILKQFIVMTILAISAIRIENQSCFTLQRPFFVRVYGKNNGVNYWNPWYTPRMNA